MVTLLIPTDASEQSVPRMLDVGTAPLIALSGGAGTIHLAVAAEHYREFAVYGLFFISLGIAQIAWSAFIAIRGLSRPLLLIAAVGNAGIAALWIVSRTSGVPIGPEPWVPESVGFAGIVATVFEVMLVSSAAWRMAGRPRTPRRWARLAWGSPVAVSALTIAAIILDVVVHGHNVSPG